MSVITANNGCFVDIENIVIASTQYPKDMVLYSLEQSFLHAPMKPLNEGSHIFNFQVHNTAGELLGKLSSTYHSVSLETIPDRLKQNPEYVEAAKNGKLFIIFSVSPAIQEEKLPNLNALINQAIAYKKSQIINPSQEQSIEHSVEKDKIINSSTTDQSLITSKRKRTIY